MAFPSHPRYQYVLSCTLQFMKTWGVTQFPIDPLAFIQKKNWGLMTYSKLAALKNTTIKNVCHAFKSTDGYSVYNGEGYFIAYNDTVQSVPRMRFTLMHEVGHIELGHLLFASETTLDANNVNQKNSLLLEKEAHCFARNCLAPAPLVLALKIHTPTELAAFFNISKDAAVIRLTLLDTDIQNMGCALQKEMETHFSYTISHYKNRTYCRKCHHMSWASYGMHCQNCGESLGLLTPMDVQNKESICHTNHFPLDQQGKAFICPTCENEDVLEGQFCHICGQNLVNHCLHCFQFALGDSLICGHCGNQTTFSTKGSAYI